MKCQGASRRGDRADDMVNREAAIKQLHEWAAETAIILGSGLSSVAHALQIKRPKFLMRSFKIPKPRAPGDAGRFVLGKIDNRRIIFAQGRVHLYEAFSAREITALVPVLARAGVKQLIITMPLARSSRNSSGANG